MRKKTKKIKIKFTNSKLNKKIILFAAVLIIVAALFAPKLIDFIGVTGKVTGWEFHNKGEITCNSGYYVAGWGANSDYHVDEYECVNYQGLAPIGTTQTWVYIWNNAISPGGGGVYCPLGKYVTGWRDLNSDWKEDEFQCSKPSGVDLMPTNCIWKHLKPGERVSCPSGQIVTGWNDQNGNWWQDLFYCCTPTPSDPISEGTWLDVRKGSSQACSLGEYVTGWNDYLPVITNWAHGDDIQDEFECSNFNSLIPTDQIWVNIVQGGTYCPSGYAVTAWNDFIIINSIKDDEIIDQFQCSKPGDVDLVKEDCTWEPVALGGKVHCLENKYVTGWNTNSDGIQDEFQCCRLTPVAPTTCTDDDDDGWCLEVDDTNCDSTGMCANGYDDCDDTNVDINPDATEDCSDGIDNDCDGLTDFEDTDDCIFYCTDHPTCMGIDINYPWCDLTTGKCVECASNLDCLGGEVCDQSLHICKPRCNEIADPPLTCDDPSLSVCGPENFCVECTVDDDCDTVTEVCDTNTHECKLKCGTHGDCLARDTTLPRCAPTNFCVECLATSDCDTAAGQDCDTTINTCIFPTITYSCTGTPPAHSMLCTGDDTGLTANTPLTLVDTCTSGVLCEYKCGTGYEKSDTTCVTISVTAGPTLTYEDVTTIGTYNLHKWTFDGGQRTIYYPAATATESELTLVYQGTSYLMGKDYHYWKIQGTTKGMLAEQGGS